MTSVLPTNTRRILHGEGIAVLLASVIAYAHFGYSWGVFALLLFVWDISMVGYWFNNRVGAIVYNAGHSYVGPLALVTLGLAFHMSPLAIIALIWFAHIGLDRALGYGLKGATFSETHLGSIRAKGHGSEPGVFKVPGSLVPNHRVQDTAGIMGLFRSRC